MTNETKLQIGVDHAGPDGDWTCVVTMVNREVLGVWRSPRKTGKTSMQWARVWRMFAAAYRLSARGFIVTSRKVPRRDA